MIAVFVDSVGLLALWNASDQWHEAARKAFLPISKGDTSLLTTTFILLEYGNAASRTPFRSEVEHLREHFEVAGTLVWPTDADWRQAWAAYRRGVVGDAGIVDHISFTVMRRMGISKVFSNDRHFKTAGFEILF